MKKKKDLVLEEFPEFIGGKQREFDKLTKSKAMLLLVYGCLICVPFCLISEILIIGALWAFGLPLAIIVPLFVAPLAEETPKLLPVLGERSPSSIVWGTFLVALGFGLTEMVWHNIASALYVGKTIFTLSITPLVHIGASCSGAYYYSRKPMMVGSWIVGLMIACFIHGFYNLVVLWL